MKIPWWDPKHKKCLIIFHSVNQRMGLGLERNNLKTHPIATACHANTICIIKGRISIQMLAGNRLLDYEYVPWLWISTLKKSPVLLFHASLWQKKCIIPQLSRITGSQMAFSEESFLLSTHIRMTFFEIAVLWSQSCYYVSLCFYFISVQNQ